MPSWDAQDYRQSWSPEAVYPDGGALQTGGLYDPRGLGPPDGKRYMSYRFPDAMV